ncbi:MAG TPA: IS3 family transposase, partial [Ktedonobacteraceae bacterium]|nr:IS3 family transposase [Ktedonobacteraceae bacterium]
QGSRKVGIMRWRKHPMSRRQREDARLTTQLQQIFVKYRGVYGSPRIHAELQDQGWQCSRKRVARFIREHGMHARHKRFHPVTTRRNPSHTVAPNLLQQDFTALRPDEKWTDDITYIPTGEGWLYLAVLLDVFSRRVLAGRCPSSVTPCWSRRRSGWPWRTASRKQTCCIIPIVEASTPATPIAKCSNGS